MSYVVNLDAAFCDASMRSSKIAPCSGMCSLCTANCAGTCEIGLSAVLGAAMVYPTTTGENQVAGEKPLPIDFSHFNINGRVFGAVGAPATSQDATIFHVNLSRTFGKTHPVKMELPLVLPALIKLNWRDYFSAAAMTGIPCVIGEDACSKDPALHMDADGKIDSFPMLQDILHAFLKYDRGYGQIILQCNTDDDLSGVPDYAVEKCGVTAMEFKFGQAAKGTQSASPVKTLEEALRLKAAGKLVHPDPNDPAVQEAYQKNAGPAFWTYGRLPMWDEEYLPARIEQLRAMGLKNVYFKMAGYDRRDIERVLRLAVLAGVDMVTFDGCGGGSGRSPSKMMNEWGLPAVCIASAVVSICKQLEAEGCSLPAITLAGGFATEDQVYKALAIGAPYVTSVGLCRSTMAAAMSGAQIGRLLEAGQVPTHLKKYGDSKETLFAHLPELRGMYGSEADAMSTGAIGAYSYLKRIGFGLQHFAALNRKFDIRYISQEDVIPLTADARRLLNGTWFDF